MDPDHPVSISSDHSPDERKSCNGISVSFLLSLPFFVWYGYQSWADHGIVAGLLGVIAAVIIAIFASPIVFVVLVLLIEGVTKIANFFAKRNP